MSRGAAVFDVAAFALFLRCRRAGFAFVVSACCAMLVCGLAGAAAGCCVGCCPARARNSKAGKNIKASG